MRANTANEGGMPQQFQSGFSQIKLNFSNWHHACFLDSQTFETKAILGKRNAQDTWNYCRMLVGRRFFDGLFSLA
jgi:hypothetical protein